MVVTIIAVVSAFSIPQLIGVRRLTRAGEMPREIVAQLRFARQQALSQQKAVTFQYNTASAQINIIQHAAAGLTVMGDSSYPTTSGAVTLRTASLANSGISASDITYGRPSGATTSALADGTNLTTATSGKVNITFQPDGSVIDSTGAPSNFALFIYNVQDPTGTARAVSVLGAGGRAKIWRYDSGTNTYME